MQSNWLKNLAKLHSGNEKRFFNKKKRDALKNFQIARYSDVIWPGLSDVTGTSTKKTVTNVLIAR